MFYEDAAISEEQVGEAGSLNQSRKIKKGNFPVVMGGSYPSIHPAVPLGNSMPALQFEFSPHVSRSELIKHGSHVAGCSSDKSGDFPRVECDFFFFFRSHLLLYEKG